MKSPTYVAELHKKLGAPSGETVESLRLLKAYLKIPSDQRFEIIELVERWRLLHRQAIPHCPKAHSEVPRLSRQVLLLQLVAVFVGGRVAIA